MTNSLVFDNRQRYLFLIFMGITLFLFLISDEIMREQFVKSGEWKLTASRIEKSEETFQKYHSQVKDQNWGLLFG